VLGGIVGARAANEPRHPVKRSHQGAIKNLAGHGLLEQVVAWKEAIAEDDEQIENSGAQLFRGLIKRGAACYAGVNEYVLGELLGIRPLIISSLRRRCHLNSWLYRVGATLNG
jgi:hypothetical protein